EFKDSAISDSFNSRLNRIINNNFKILILSGWHKNKNIEIVPDILYHLNKKGIKDINFIITVSPNHPESIKLSNKANELNVKDKIIYFDSVNPDEVYHLLEKIDAIILMSLLESFSNNIIEAWYFKK